jgi:hypothetical protein
MAGMFDLDAMNLAQDRAMGTQIANNIDKGGYAAGLFAPELARATVSGVTDALGLKGGDQKNIDALKGILSGVDQQDPNSLAQAASKLMGMGMTQEAQSFMEEARKLAESSSKINLQSAQADYYSGRNDAALRPKQFQVDAKMKLLDEALTSGKITQKEYDLGVQNVLQANLGMNNATIGAKSRAGYDPTANTLHDFGEFSGDPSLLNTYLNNRVAAAGAPAVPKTSTGFNNYLMLNGYTPDILAAMTPDERQQVRDGYVKFTESTKSGSAPNFNKAMGLTAGVINNLYKDDKSSSYLMGAQQLFSEGNVDGARNLVNQAQQATQSASDNTLSGINDAYVSRDVNKSVEKLNAQENGVNQIIGLLKNPENWNNPKIINNIASTYLSANSPTSIRALAELEGLKNADSIIQRLEDAMSKMGTGTPTNAEIEQYNSAAKELLSAIKGNKLSTLRSKVEQYANSPYLKSDAKVPSFLASFGVHGASMVSDNAGNKPNGYKTVNKDGDVFVVVNGKVYKGRM